MAGQRPLIAAGKKRILYIGLPVNFMAGLDPVPGAGAVQPFWLPYKDATFNCAAQANKKII
jgi:hypothetical protein